MTIDTNMGAAAFLSTTCSTLGCSWAALRKDTNYVSLCASWLMSAFGYLLAFLVVLGTPAFAPVLIPVAVAACISPAIAYRFHFADSLDETAAGPYVYGGGLLAITASLTLLAMPVTRDLRQALPELSAVGLLALFGSGVLLMGLSGVAVVLRSRQNQGAV